MVTQFANMLKIHISRIFLWIFLGVLIFGGMSFDFGDNQPWIVKTYKQKLHETEYRQALKNSQRQYDYLKSQGISWPRTESLEKEVLRHLIANLLIKNVAEQFNFAVPSILLQEKLEEQLTSLPEYFFDAQGQLNVAMLEKLIAPQSFESLLENMQDEIQSNLLYNMVSIGSYVCQFEVSTQMLEEFADKKYSIMHFSLKQALEKVKEKSVSDETLEHFYKKAEHGDLYKTAEKRSGVYWKFHSKDYGLTVSKSEVSSYYDQHKHDYLETPAQVQVHRIFFAQHDNYDAKAQAQIVHDELVANPKTFASVAKKIADLKLSYQGSEKTEYFAKDSTKYDTVFINEAFEQLTEDQAISSLIKTKQGYEILQRIGRKSAKYKSLEDVRQQIEEKLLEEKFTKRFQQDAQRVIGNAHYHKDGLDLFIEKRNGCKETIHLEERKMNLIGMQLFQTDAGHYAVFMDGKQGILLECQEVEKKALKPFNIVKNVVRENYYKKQAEQELKAMTTDACKQVSKADFESFAQEHNAHFEKAESVYKNDQMSHSEILRNHEIAQKLKMLSFVGAVIAITTPTDGYVIRLDAIKPIDENVVKDKKPTAAMTLANKERYEVKHSFIDSLYRHVKLENKIEIKEQLIKEIKDAVL